jgi:hypothetical protein
MAAPRLKLAEPQSKAEAPETQPPSDLNTADINAVLRQASYLTFYSMPDPGKEDQLLFDGFRVVAIDVNEELHRFPVNLAAGTCVGERLANIHLEWTPVPEGFRWSPGALAAPTPLDPGQSQLFTMLNGRLACLDDAKSYLRGEGRGRTYPIAVGGSQQLHLSGIVEVIETGGEFKGLEGTVVTNGHIRPPHELSLLIVARFTDPEGKLRSGNLGLPEAGVNPDPDYASLVLIAEPDPESPGKLRRDTKGRITGWEANEVLRLVSLDCAGGAAMRCLGVEPGPVVGRHTAVFNFHPESPDAMLEVLSEEGVFSFHDRAGQPAGSLRVDLKTGQAFVSKQKLSGIYNEGTPEGGVYRFGANGPIETADCTGIFSGSKGMMTVNGAFTLAPIAGSTLYMFRLHDGQGALRSAMRDSWALKRTWVAGALEQKDAALLDLAAESVAEGLELKSWWESQHAAGERFQERFEIIRSSHPADRSYGFYDEAPLRSGRLRMLGCYQEMMFDRPGLADRRWKENLREYVLHYFLRTSGFREPAPVGGGDLGAFQQGFRGLSPDVYTSLHGLSFTQQYFRLVTGETGSFAAEDRCAVVDQRDLGSVFAWIVMKANVHDFKLVLRPFGTMGPQLVLPLQQETWLVTGPGFVVDKGDEFGVGYAILRHAPLGRFLAYGPSQFEHGFGSIVFRIERDNTIRVRMAFAANRPTKVMNIPYDPVEMTFRAAKKLSMGATKKLTDVLDSILPSFAGTRGFDPVQAYIALANGLTGGAAGQHFGFSLAQLERSFLVQHYMDHYRMIRGALMTYRSVPDWQAEASLPWSIRTGVPDGPS